MLKVISFLITSIFLASTPLFGTEFDANQALYKKALSDALDPSSKCNPARFKQNLLNLPAEATKIPKKLHTVWIPSQDTDPYAIDKNFEPKAEALLRAQSEYQENSFEVNLWVFVPKEMLDGWIKINLPTLAPASLWKIHSLEEIRGIFGERYLPLFDLELDITMLAGAKDLLFLAILYQNGGIAFDLDLKPKSKNIDDVWCKKSTLGLRAQGKFVSMMAFAPGHIFPLLGLEYWYQVNQKLQAQQTEEKRCYYDHYKATRQKTPSAVISSTGQINAQVLQILFKESPIEATIKHSSFMDFLDFGSSYTRAVTDDEGKNYADYLTRISQINEELKEDQNWLYGIAMPMPIP